MQITTIGLDIAKPKPFRSSRQDNRRSVAVIISDRDVGRAETLLVKLRDLLCPIGRRAAWLMKVSDTPIFKPTPATHNQRGGRQIVVRYGESLRCRAGGVSMGVIGSPPPEQRQCDVPVSVPTPLRGRAIRPPLAARKARLRLASVPAPADR